MRARLAWVEAMRVTYAQSLELLGVSAPERMDRPAGEDEERASEEPSDSAAG